MRIAVRILQVLAVVLIAVIGWLTFASPDLIRVGANYSAKLICSNLVLASRDPHEVLAVDVQAPGHPLLRLMRVSVEGDPSSGPVTVHTGLFGFIGGGRAVGTAAHGCTTTASGTVPGFMETPAAEMAAQPGDALWPEGNRVSADTSPELAAILSDDALTGPGLRAVIVVKDGEIIGERYGNGFDATTPLLGWSVTKTVTAALIGRAIREGSMTLEDDLAGLGWTDGRDAIRLADLMGMASDLTWNEGYGSVSDVTRMLYLEDDMAGFAASMPLDDETPTGIGETFEYSSGTTVLLSRIWQDAIGADAHAFPQQALFVPLGMTSAVMERDAAGTYVGSSYMYANARDWARFGQFMLQRGVWEGRSLLPVGFADWMVTPHPASSAYGNGQVWLEPANSWMLTGEDAPLPDDAFFMNGHDGQSINVIPSEGLVVVRLGLTPTSRGYRVSHLLGAVIDATQQK